MNGTEKGKDDNHFYKEYFNLAFVLRGEVNYLEEIKLYIINNFAHKKLVKLIKPTYEKEKLLIVDEIEWQKFQKFTIKKERKPSNDYFYFAFIVRGEVIHLEKIKEYITQCDVDVITAVYAKERVYIVEESRWNQYKRAESQDGIITETSNEKIHKKEVNMPEIPNKNGN